MTTENSEYGICDWLHSGLVRVCYICHPGESVFQARPELDGLGLEVSHCLCAAHREQLTAGVMKMKLERAALKQAA